MYIYMARVSGSLGHSATTTRATTSYLPYRTTPAYATSKQSSLGAQAK